MPTLTWDDDSENVVIFPPVAQIVADACRAGSFEAAHRAGLERRRDASWLQFIDAACDATDALNDKRDANAHLREMMRWRAAWRAAVEELARLDGDRPSDTEG